MQSKVFTIATIAIGFFAETFLYGIVVPVLPFMLEERMVLPHDDLQYYCSLLLTTYSAASLVFAPVAGTIADRVFPRKLPFLLALAIMITVWSKLAVLWL
jgi:MFS family permease